MNVMRKNVLPYFMAMFLVVAVFLAHSQGQMSASIPSLAPNTPIDGGLFLLIAAGLIYGGKILYRKD
jgi:hypothetical protein